MDQSHFKQLHHHQYSVSPLNIDASCGDTSPPWGIQETRDFLIIRAELDLNFIGTKRLELMWGVISTQMKEKGYARSVEQCKSKWKDLVTRFKECQTMEGEGTRQQFPFFDELQAMSTARMLYLEIRGGVAIGIPGSSKKKDVSSPSQFVSSEEFEKEDGDKEKAGAANKKRKLKGTVNVPTPSAGSGSILSGIKEMMDDFVRQQMHIEMQLMQAYEKREEEGRVKEIEWRQQMEALANDRLVMERKWREKDEERKNREEARAEKRDALISALMDKLKREDDM